MSSVASSVAGGPVKLGDRVIVSSQTAGTKTGTLRFLGPTDFAAGEWAGVELDAPIGKNDGSVGEKRYFECKPKFGLFAPLNKVCFHQNVTNHKFNSNTRYFIKVVNGFYLL